jgi:hypothetical protein
MKQKPIDLTDDLRPEYDFDYSQAERGRHYKRLLKEGANIVVLEPDVAKAFPDSATVNSALRSLLEVARLATGAGRHVARSTKSAARRAG